MNNIQANPVETIKKDIYIIKNKINNKIYVGQSKNAKIRFKQHCKLSNMNNSEIGKAISKYGKENFDRHVTIPTYWWSWWRIKLHKGRV